MATFTQRDLITYLYQLRDYFLDLSLDENPKIDSLFIQVRRRMCLSEELVARRITLGDIRDALLQLGMTARETNPIISALESGGITLAELTSNSPSEVKKLLVGWAGVSENRVEKLLSVRKQLFEVLEKKTK